MSEAEVSKQENVNGYKSILKRISAFGGIQIFTILISLVRGKFVALFLGPEGMGISSMFTTSSKTLEQLGGLGLNLAMVREVSAAGDGESRRMILNVATRLIYFTALLGCFLCLVLSPLLSKWSFGSYDYTFGFILLSLGVGASVAASGYYALLQGCGEIKTLGYASVIGGTAGLFFGVPMYWLWGFKGIVPALLVYAFTVFLFNFFSFRRKNFIGKISQPWHEGAHPLIKRLISLGFVLMIGSLSGSLTNYVINIFVRTIGTLEDVGYFQAANSLTNQYIGIVFGALSLDYFPRLSAVANEKEKLNEVVNTQIEIMTLLVTPLILLLFLFAPLVVRLLLTDNFLVIVPLVRWLAMGVLLQTMTFPLSYIYFAKGDKKIYVWVEIVIGNLMWILCSILFYYLFDLIGLGISLVARTLVDVPILYIISKKRYGFSINRKVMAIAIFNLFMGICGFLVLSNPEWNPYLAILPVLVISLLTSGYIMIKKSQKRE